MIEISVVVQGVVEGNLRDRLRSLSLEATIHLTSQTTFPPALRVSPRSRQPKLRLFDTPFRINR